MGRMKFTQEQLDIVMSLLPRYELDLAKLADDLIILPSRVHGEPISVQMELVHRERATVCRRIAEMKEYYERMRVDYPEYNLPRSKHSKEEDYMDTH